MPLLINELNINTLEEGAKSAVYTFEPLPTGFGHTLGSALRRVLYTTLEGGAITQVKISGVDHQFTTLEGVKEDIVEITMNLKKIRVKMHSDNPVVLNINKKGAGPVTGKDIEGSSEVEVLNKDLVIATLSDKNTEFKAELIIEKGMGYSPMEERQSNKIGVIVLDALYSPVTRVSYKVEPTRFGKTVNLDKLTVTIETDGSIEPKEALVKSAKTLSDFFGRIGNWQTKVKEDESSTSEDKPKEAKVVENINVEELPLPTRTMNALKKQGINTLSQLVAMTDEELSDIKNLGEKSVQEIKKLLKKEGYR